MNKAKMETINGGKDNNSNKLTYEQLNDTCAQLYQQNQNLVRQLRQMDMSNMFKRLDYLFMVLANASVIKDADFIDRCVNEIKDALTIQSEDNADVKE